jgi:predicted dehydrogenase
MNTTKKLILILTAWSLTVLFVSCTKKQEPSPQVPKDKAPIRLITLDPGHFHAALVQKTMYEQVSSTVHVYAPAGSDVQDHLNRIEGYNSRTENPTSWKEIVYTGDDFFQKMIQEKKGNVVVISGSNKKKAQYIKACVEAGLNVLADKPMCIDPQGFEILKQAFQIAKQKGVLIYDIMTERSEITTILQKELAHNKEVFGTFRPGSPDEPAIVKESVHHFFKYVSGNPIKRPGWYFDTTQQGEGIVDVTTHLVDLVMWEALPEQTIDYKNDIDIRQAKRWPTLITKDQYKKVTRLDEFPTFLKPGINDQGVLECYANGEIIFNLKDLFAKVSVTWNYQAPEGTGDTHYSIVRGTNANIEIRQGKEQNFRPELYIEASAGADKNNLSKALIKAVFELQAKYPGVSIIEFGNGWQIIIPEKYRIGHEAHFGQVMQRFMTYLEQKKMPDWEEPNMMAKYYTTTQALQKAKSPVSSSDTSIDFLKGKNQIDVVINDRLFTSYCYGPELTKPVLYPVKSPSGLIVNRGYPLKQIAGESTDHPHHVGIFFTYDEVNEDGFWNNTTSLPQIKHIEVKEMTPGSKKGTLSTLMHWTGKSGNVLLEENRTMTFLLGNNEYAIDFDIDLTAGAEKVVFHDTKEGMFAIRVADWMTEENGTGQYLSSNGARNEKNIWGRRAKWVRLEGKKDGKTIGIAILNHPDSVNYPTFWHARGYGLFSANPLGQLIFQQGTNKPNPKPLELTLQPGQKAHFKFLMLIYEGPRTKEQLETLFEQFARIP